MAFFAGHSVASGLYKGEGLERQQLEYSTVEQTMERVQQTQEYSYNHASYCIPTLSLLPSGP